MKQAKPVYRKLARRLDSLADPQQAQLHLCLQIALQHAAPLLEPASGLQWLLRTADAAWQEPLCENIERWRHDAASHDDLHKTIASLPGEPAHIVTTCFEQLLAALPGTTRRRQGVYYTPRILAGFVVRGATQALTDPMKIPGGLVGLLEETGGMLLDPAAGAGVFLTATIRIAHDDFLTRTQQTPAAWNAFVDNTLLPALNGVELMLPACALAHINIALALHATGYSFSGSTPPKIQNRNALQPEPETNRLPIIVGNPPYAALTTRAGGWIGQLMKGNVPGQGGDVSYYQVNGQPLGERKLWLHDEYVQFLRYAQYCVDRAGGGVTAFVTNRGFLDNITFRGVRNALMHSYTSAHIVDLFPGGKNGQLAAEPVDENVFDIDQGVAATIFAAPPDTSGFGLHYGRLTGSREDKLSLLDNHNPQELTQKQETSPPHYFLTPQSAADPFYEHGWALDEIMPLHAPAVVTARDKLVIGFSREEVASRIDEFCDPSIPDHIIRQRFFPRARSQRYPAGDTRSWKLTTARKALAAQHDRNSNIRACTYRAADQRYIYWSPAMVDWPRTAVSRVMLMDGNLAFIARRQSPPGRSCNFFWAADNLILDGVLRSDNRGGETFFPWRRFAGAEDKHTATSQMEANLQPEFHAAVQTVLQRDVTAEQIMQMIFALFHSPAYRTQFAAGLRTGFPRIFIPATGKLFTQLAEIGARLIHLLKTNETDTTSDRKTSLTAAVGCTLPSRNYPQWKAGKIYLQAELPIAIASQQAWEFRAGAHQICHKWLRDRRGRELTREMVQQYMDVLHTASEMTDAMATLDRIIAAVGGFEAGFAGRRSILK